MDEGTAALAEEEEEEEADVGGALPQQQEAALRGASGRDAARSGQLEAKPELLDKDAADKAVAAAEDVEMAEVWLWPPRRFPQVHVLRIKSTKVCKTIT